MVVAVGYEAVLAAVDAVARNRGMDAACLLFSIACLSAAAAFIVKRRGLKDHFARYARDSSTEMQSSLVNWAVAIVVTVALVLLIVSYKFIEF